MIWRSRQAKIEKSGLGKITGSGKFCPQQLGILLFYKKTDQMLKIKTGSVLNFEFPFSTATPIACHRVPLGGRLGGSRELLGMTVAGDHVDRHRHRDLGNIK